MEFQSYKLPTVNTATAMLAVMEDQILIFCTSLQTLDDVQKISPALNSIPEIKSWSVDLEDCDKVLRVVSESYLMSGILNAIEKTGFNILEMPD